MGPENGKLSQADLNPQVEQILDSLKKKPSAYLVAVTGIPGSGKSTLCSAVSSQIPDSVVIPMDGYHLPRNQLSREAMERRGAPHTFDYDLLRKDLEKLRQHHQGSFPAFDHAVKDPEPDAIQISTDTEIVFVEGNYLLLQEWNLEALFDFTIFVDCDLSVAMNRVAQRLYRCGICASPEEAMQQVKNNDLLNAQCILADGIIERSDLCLKQS